jgi:hypothetical protein
MNIQITYLIRQLVLKTIYAFILVKTYQYSIYLFSGVIAIASLLRYIQYLIIKTQFEKMKENSVEEFLKRAKDKDDRNE